MGLLGELRSGTGELHQRVERRIDVLARCEDRSAYAGVLSGFRSVYAPVERTLAGSPTTVAVMPDWPARVKTPWLDEDLAALGVPTPDDVPAMELAGAAEIVGAAYVFEGATLGGAIVVRHLAARASELPRRFFGSYGDRRAPMWQSFRRYVEQFEQRARPGEAEVNIAVVAARRTFLAIEAACTARRA
jgi:heme oxygenase